MLINAEQEISRELGSSEQLNWAGVPRQGVLLRGADVFLIPFSLLWCGFAIFWEFMAISGGAPIFFLLWGIPFVLVGLYFVFGRFLFEARQRSVTYYGVTSERIIIVSGLFQRKVKSLSLKGLGEIALSEKADGSGTITFGAGHPFTAMFGGISWPGMNQYMPPAFESIEQARQVYERIRQAQQAVK
jgi:hypothetical protein